MTTEYPDVDGVGDVGYWFWSVDDNFPCDDKSELTTFQPTRADVRFELTRKDVRFVVRRLPSRARHLRDVFMVSIDGFVFYMTRHTGEASFTQRFRGRRQTPTADGSIELPDQYLLRGIYSDVAFLLERRELYVRRHSGSIFGPTFWMRLELPEDFWNDDLFSGECRKEATITGRIWLEQDYEGRTG